MKRAVAVIKAGIATGFILVIYAFFCVALEFQIQKSVLISGGLAAFVMLLIRFSKD